MITANLIGERSFVWVYWMAAQNAQIKKARIKRSHKDQLVRCFVDRAGRHKALHIKDWANSQTICSHRDLTNPPAHYEITSNRLRDPHFDGRLFFASLKRQSKASALFKEL